MTVAVAERPAGLPWEDHALRWSIAILVVAQATVVGLQVIGRHVFRQPIPWTEEIARLLLAWLMCIGGVSALRHTQNPRVTAMLRVFPDQKRAAVERGLQLVLLAFFLSLVVPAWHLTVASAGERLPASGLSGAAISGVLPVALLMMSAVVIQQVYRDGIAAWRDRTSLLWSVGAAGLSIASVLVPLVAGAAPLVVLIVGFLITAALGVPLAFTLALTSLTYLLGIGGVSLIILPIKILGGVDSFVLLAIPLFIVAGVLMEAGGISERTVSGSTTADVSAISSLLVPSMRRAGYSGAESVSVVAAASAMGILVPPCLTMVVLGSLVNLSIVTLFLAGFLPAFVLAAALLLLIAIRARRQKWPISAPLTRADVWRAARRAVVPTGLPILLFGGIFSGFTTVTEAALLAVVYALVAGIAMGGIKRGEIVGQLAQSGVVTSTTLWVLAAASAFAWILVREWVPQMLGEWIRGAGAGRVEFLTMTIALFVVIGALLEGLPALLIFGPILFPISRSIGIDPVHYGIVVIAAMGVAFFLPPVGVGLTIAASVGRVDIDDVSRTFMPYLLALLAGLALVAASPWITLVLPRWLLHYKG
jgi:tripartite ATP-independent transporter DctM subunit